MSPQTIESPTGARQRTRSCATGLVCHRCENSYPARVNRLLVPGLRQGPGHRLRLRARRRPLPRLPQLRAPAERLALRGAACRSSTPRAQARVGQHSGYTPLIRADRLGAELGIANLYLKDDSSNRPSLSYKDRVVSMSIARLLERGKTEIGCVSTGNVGTAVASLAAKAGVDAYICLPQPPRGDEGALVHGARREGPARSRATTTKPTAAAVKLAEATGMDFANITLRPFYAEGAKTAAFEIVEQLDWDSPEHIVSPAAGGTLSSRMHKGLNELELLGLAETERARRSTSPSRAAATRSPRRSSPRRPRSTR